MADQKIIDYLRQNRDKYPIETLKEALIKNGFAPAAVDEGLQIVMGQAAHTPPIAPGAPETTGAPADEGQYVRYTPGNMIANALHMIKEPEDFFSRLDPAHPIGPAVLNVVLWSAISAALSAILSMLGFGLLRMLGV